MDVTMTLKQFLGFCRCCILSERGYSDYDIGRYGVSFNRVTFDSRVFSYEDLQILQGEVYIMYEVVYNKLYKKQYKVTKLYNLYLFISPDNSLFMMDKYLLHAGVFRYRSFYAVDFSVENKSSDSLGFNEVYKFDNLRTVKMIHGACHPYVYLTFRDMTISLSLSDWTNLKEICMRFDESHIPYLWT